VVASVRIGITGLAAKNVLCPGLEVLRSISPRVAVDSAALEEIDHDLMDQVDVAAELEGVVSMNGVEDVGNLGTVLIRLSDAGQRVGQTVSEDAHADAWSWPIGSGGLKVAAILEVNLVNGAGGDLCCEPRNQEALVVAGRSVG
jgi:hypothetical protein